MEKEKNNQIWLAAHIYYARPHETLLKDCILPLIEEFTSKRWSSNYFFIRYMDKGPHVRLRFKIEKDQQSLIKPILSEKVGQFLKEHPSHSFFDDPGIEFDTRGWYPNNSIQFIDYEPEIDRYGGPEALFLAEALFQASTDATLACISQAENWSYQNALGCAIQMHLSFAHAAGMDLQEIKKFFKFINLIWLEYSYGINKKKIIDEADKKKKIEASMEMFKKSYEEQSAVLLPFHKQLWSGLENQVEFEEDWMNKWREDVIRILNEYKILSKSKKINKPSYLGEFLPYPVMYFIYDSFIHMTNNRLGIWNRDEAFLGYLIYQSVAQISE